MEKVRLLKYNKEMGTCVELYKDKNERLLVVKRIRNIQLPICEALFTKEQQALQRLRGCENIVKIYNADVRLQNDGMGKEGIILMEYINGETLSKKIESISSVQVKYGIIKQLINAVRYAHNNSVIHRDINPSNILITEDNKVKLIDFGTAKIRGHIQQGTTYQFATKNYSAPEAAQHSGNATEKSDIYSLGAVIYFVFTEEDPPVACEMEDAICGTPGLDTTLKNILCKMCAEDPEDRYESIDDCEDAFEPLYSRYCRSNEEYCFVVPLEVFESMRKMHIVRERLTKQQICQDYLRSQFSGAYASCMRQGDGMIRFDGRSVFMECKYEDDGLFIVGKVAKLEACKKEQRRRYSLETQGIFHFYPESNKRQAYQQNNTNLELFNAILDFDDDLKSRKNINIEFDNQFGIWERFLRVMIDDASKNAIRLKYNMMIQEEDILLFSISDDIAFDDVFSNETTFCIESESDHSSSKKLTEIGMFLEYRDDGTVLAIKRSNRRITLPKSGTICVDYKKDIAQYERQLNALHEFVKAETNNNEDLKAIFVGIESPEKKPQVNRLVFFDKHLDLTQKKAVKKILYADGIALVQGPPGTGKTNVLVEVVRQILKENEENPASRQKILIVSQAHSAVDKLLSDLSPHIGCGTSLIRIGTEDKIEESINQKYGINTSRVKWAQDSVDSCKKELEARLSCLDVDVQLFEEYISAKDDLYIIGKDNEERILAEECVSSFEKKYAGVIGRKEFQQCVIMSKWCRQLEESNEIGEYYIKDADIVAGTCSGFLADKNVREIVFDYVIVDEAAKATLPEIMMSIVKARKVIMVGDHKQLPPVFHTEVLDKNSGVNVEELKASGFGKLFDMLETDFKQVLSTQYRMHPCIGDLISLMFYNGEVQNGVTEQEKAIELPFLQSNPILWISTSKCENRMENRKGISNRTSYVNQLEVTGIQKCLVRIDKEMADHPFKYSVGVITPYKAQLDLIRERTKQLGLRNIKVDVNTVDAFQGSQRDIIIYSTVRSNNRRSIGFIKEQARLNVSFSRAIRALIIIGDYDFLGDTTIHKNLYPMIQSYIKEKPECCKVIELGGI